MEKLSKFDSAVIVLSGGQDSTTCAFWARERFKELHTVTINYGQRHRRELDAAAAISERVGARTHEVIDVGPILKGTSPLTNADEKLEQYANFDVLPGGLEKTFVPARNLLFLTLAANRAYVLGTNHMVTGVCQEDFGGYPDCRQVFIDAVEEALNEGYFTGKDGAPKGARIHTPLMFLTKAQSVDLALRLGKDCYEALGYSHTSYDGAYPPTGKDHATLLREKGFFEAGVPDPLVVRAVVEGLMELPARPEYDMLRDVEHVGHPYDAAINWIFAQLEANGKVVG
jgi:7-cyano-7-deazaguanine synthase